MQQCLIQISIWKKGTKKTKTCLNVGAKVDQRTRKQVGLQTDRERRRSEQKPSKMFGTQVNFWKTWKNPNKTTSYNTQTKYRHHIQAKSPFLRMIHCLRIWISNCGSLKQTTKWAPIKWLVKTLSPLKHTLFSPVIALMVIIYSTIQLGGRNTDRQAGRGHVCVSNRKETNKSG